MEGHAPCSGGVEHRLSGLGASWPAPVGGEPPGFGEGGDGRVMGGVLAVGRPQSPTIAVTLENVGGGVGDAGVVLGRFAFRDRDGGIRVGRGGDAQQGG